MPGHESGVELEDFKSYDIPVQRVHVLTEEAAKYLRKPCGTYTTITPGPLDKLESLENICNCLAEQLRPHLLPFFGRPLCVCGIGNQDIPADSLGPEAIRQITPFFYEAAQIPSNFSKVAAICPGVLGKTNLSTETIISGVASAMNATCVLTVDSCVTQEADRLCSTIQLSNTGMDNRWQTVSLRQSVLGVPVVSVAVPTALSVSDFSSGDNGLQVSSLAPSNVGEIINTAALIIACAITQAAYPSLDYESCRQCIELSAYNLPP